MKLQKFKLEQLITNEVDNCRIDYQLSELIDSIKVNGLNTPLQGILQSDGNVLIIDGFRRTRALKLLEYTGEIPVILTGTVTSETDKLYIQSTANSGKNLNQVEYGELVRRLLLNGESMETICKRLNKPENWLTEAIGLSYMPSAITESIKAGETSVNAVKQALKAGNTSSELESVIKEAKAINAKPILPKVKAGPKEASSKKVNVEKVLMEIYQGTGKEWVITLIEVLNGNMNAEVLINEINLTK